jgi:uncharacterized hydrophobic protein (TIGR00271 family)
MGVLSGLIDAGGEHRSTLADVEQELFVSLGSRSAKITRFWVLLVLASVIAAGGVVGNSTPAVIGAMIMTPLATPLYGVALSAVLGERRHLRDALLLLAAGVVVSVLIGVLMALLTFDRMPLDANTQIVGRTAPAVLDLVIAIAAGLAGAYALVRRDVANILAGVAIAITLVPVLEVAGISLGSGRLDLALGAFLLFLTNAAAIMLGGMVVFTAAGYERAASRAPSRRHYARFVVAALVVAVVVPLTISSVRSYRYLRWADATEAATRSWVEGTGWHVTGVNRVGDEIVATVIGQGAPPAIPEFRTLVRRAVPGDVTVRLIESNGTNVTI